MSERRRRKYELVADIDCDEPPHRGFSGFPVLEGQIKIPKRFIQVAQNVVEILERKTEFKIGVDDYTKDPQSSRWVNSSGHEAFENVADVLGKSKSFTVADGEEPVEYFKRDNVGGKTRWFKVSKSPEPHEATCVVQNINSSAQKYFLQALLVQMDKRLHSVHTEHLQAILNLTHVQSLVHM